MNFILVYLLQPAMKTLVTTHQFGACKTKTQFKSTIHLQALPQIFRPHQIHTSNFFNRLQIITLFQLLVSKRRRNDG